MTTQVIDKPWSFCKPGCGHKLTIYRKGGFWPAPRGGPSVKGRPKLCAIVDRSKSGPNSYETLLTACGEIIEGPCSISHRWPTCPKCRQALDDKPWQQVG